MSERCPGGLCALASSGDDLERMCSGMAARITELEAALTERDRRLAELEAALVAKDACWHCKVALIPSRPRCEVCPEECDDEACSDEGCQEQRELP